MTSPSVIAVDVGGTKTDVALVAPDGTVSFRSRLNTVELGPRLFDAIVDAVGAIDTPSTTPIGVGCGGPMEPGGETVSPLNIAAWRNFPLLTELARATGRAVTIDNDAKALALAEGRFGGATGLSNYVSMVVSTGVGGGIVLDGKLLDGALGNAGHIGHIVVNPGGTQCGCGVLGCLEAEASGTGIRLQTGADAAQASELVRARTGVMVGRAVASVCSLLDVTQFFVAGSVALGFGEPFFRAANEEALAKVGLSFARAVEIHPSQLGGDGPILGAACVAWRKLGL